MSLENLNGIYRETVLSRAETPEELTTTRSVSGERLLPTEEWERSVVRLGVRLGLPMAQEIRTEELPLREVSPLREERDRFLVTALLRREGDKLTVATVSWPKTGFDEWWAAGAGAGDRRMSRTDDRPEATATAPGEFGDLEGAAPSEAGCRRSPPPTAWMTVGP